MLAIMADVRMYRPCRAVLIPCIFCSVSSRHLWGNSPRGNSPMTSISPQKKWVKCWPQICTKKLDLLLYLPKSLSFWRTRYTHKPLPVADPGAAPPPLRSWRALYTPNHTIFNNNLKKLNLGRGQHSLAPFPFPNPSPCQIPEFLDPPLILTMFHISAKLNNFPTSNIITSNFHECEFVKCGQLNIVSNHAGMLSFISKFLYSLQRQFLRWLKRATREIFSIYKICLHTIQSILRWRDRATW